MTDSEILPSSAEPSLAPKAEARPVPPLWGIVVLAALVVTGIGLRSTSSIVAPVFLVITLVITVAPFRRMLVKRGLPSWLASTVALITIYLILVLILGAVVWSLARMVTTLPNYAAQFNNLLNSVLGQLAQFGISEEQIRNTASSLDLSSFTGIARTLLSGITGGASLLALMLAIAIFLAFDAGTIGARLALIRESRPQTAAGFSDFAFRVRKYWVVTTIFGLIVAVIDVIGLLIIGVPLALTWGVLAFVTNYIPNIGFIIGLIPPALIALLDGGVGPALAVLIVYVAVNIVVQTIIQPRFTGDAVGISSTVAFLSLIVWAYLLGAMGALLAVPATLLVKSLMVDHSSSGRWFGALIDADPTEGGQPARRPGASIWKPGK